MYLSVKSKFLIAISLATLWFVLCTWLALHWIRDLAQYIGFVLSFTVIFLIALLPGFMNVFLLSAYMLDRRPKAKPIKKWPNISVMVAALNEEKLIADTVVSLGNQDYEGNLEIIAIDNGSTDRTFEILQKLKMKNLIVLQEQTKGKSHALNKGLSRAKYDYIVTVDADTSLLTDAIKQLVIRLFSTSSHTAAVAGSVYVKNSRESFMTRLQEWDYFHSIAIIKRMQSLLQGTLVAQGAFSIYKKRCLEEVGAWPPTVGEDIVLTWGLLEKGYRIDFAEKAIAFTSVPVTYKAFFKQRSRWARGMFEAFIAHPKVLIVPKLPTFIIYWDLFFPAIDSAFFFVFIPGVIAAFFGYDFLAGPMTLAVLPITILMNLICFFGQRKMFHEHNLKVRSNFIGFLFYIILYYPIMLPSIMYGYISEIFLTEKKWGTKH